MTNCVNIILYIIIKGGILTCQIIYISKRVAEYLLIFIIFYKPIGLLLRIEISYYDNYNIICHRI